MAENKTFLFQVEDRSAGVRLDLLIPQFIPDLSRNGVQNMIRQGLITVNDRPATKRYLARSSDRLRVTLPPPEVTTFRPENIPLTILFEDDEIVRKSMLPLSLSYDHRLIDGAEAARFLRWIAEALEEPAKLVFT